ncbi:insulin-like growth factor binding protein [Cristinia sonorae]|uniref:Insulin-like growth factor binding protein n=1 Tax=Cristinia sonorae TaxID=1940300 RepID=A0A8K0UP12_9AGAR|nr:insulin-like growth factor binding protein [Cristinia sonorae]
MLASLLTVFPVVFGAFVAAQSSPTVVCVAGQCLQGFTNTTIGATLSAPGSGLSVLLLPGQYDSNTNPQLLHSLLTSPSTKLSSAPGFANGSSISLPMTVALQPGLSTYPQAFFAGSGTFTPLPESNATISASTFSAGSIMLGANVWAAVASTTSSTERVILWDSVHDLSQVSRLSSSLSVLEIQSASCSPPCAGAGICSASGTCTCPAGFAGSSCETCAPGFFGPNCQSCPSGCASCDEGITGTGRCLVPVVPNPPSSCNCLNGACGSNGQCTCNPGWTTGDNGTACAKCASGFFLTSDGNCQVCQLGCTQCADGTGDCITCKSGFTQDANDRTKCIPAQSQTSAGTTCPDGSFNNGNTCTPCSPLCQTCSGPTSNDCIICGAGRVSLGGSCVSPDGNGVCTGSTMIADNNKHQCDSCPAKCTSCKIPNFNVASTVNQLQCTGCLPGFVLSQGKCVESCPSGTFLDPRDNLTCQTCDSTCGTCAGSSTFCLTCANNQLASDGKCVASCPSNTFSASGACLSCHPDCASCSGSAFNQCSSCPSDRPVLTNGRCLPTCSKNQFFDKTSSSCQSCDASCSSCSGSGPSNCLACASSSQVLRSGSCVAASCNGGSSVLPGLGVCLSELVSVPVASGTSTPAPLPTISGINTPTVPDGKPRTLAWWQILLMALGCAFIFLMFLICWRRQARKKRAQATAKFAAAKRLNDKTGWRWKLVRFGERLFGHKPVRRLVTPPASSESYRDFKMEKMRATATEEARHERDVDNILDGYDYSRPSSRYTVSTRASIPRTTYDYEQDTKNKRVILPQRSNSDANRLSATSLSATSMYSQVTGMPRRTPEPRQPVKNARDLLPSRFSGTSYSTSARSGPSVLPPPPPPSPPQIQNLLDDSRPPTPAQEYVRLMTLANASQTVVQQPQPQPQPTETGTTNASNVSRNPFLRR